MAWGASAGAEQGARPWAQWFPYPLPLSSRDAPPFGPGLAPAGGAARSAPRPLLRPLLSGAMTRRPPGAQRAPAPRSGVRPFKRPRSCSRRPAAALHDRRAVRVSALGLAGPVRMVGPGCWEPPTEPPAWLEEITRPLVLVTTSSEFQDDGRLVRTALDALADEDVQVVATLPAAELGFAPQRTRGSSASSRTARSSTRAACAITHGGAGATQKALAAGVPVCVVPFGRDQLEVARRVEVANAGTRLPAQQAQRRAAPRPGPPRDHQTRRRAPCRGRLQRERWSPHRSGRIRNPCRSRDHEPSGPITHRRIDTTLVATASPSAPGEIRTPDLRFRRPTLYPAELRARGSRV